ncbi:acyl-CoA dehydrogenase, partial [Microbacterium sp. zg.Y909]|nr:acyl-CoA dehydrogenase [Microbacterium sp. zg.Y909]
MADASAYTPPVEDYAFLFTDAFGQDLVARATGGELTAEDATDIIAGAGEFAASVIAPLEVPGDRVGARLEDGQVRLPAG